MLFNAKALDQPSIFCNWQNNHKFTDGHNVCYNSNCGWLTTCPPAKASPTAALATVLAAAPTAAKRTATEEKTKNAYRISLSDESIDVASNAARHNNEIILRLNITTDNISELSNPVKVFDYKTCKTIEYGPSMLGASAITNASVPYADTDGVFSAVPIEVDLNTTDIMRYNASSKFPGFFNAQDESVILQFCLKPTLGSIEGYRDGVSEQSYISYAKIKIQLKLDMTMDFSTAAVKIEEEAPAGSTENASVEFTRKSNVHFVFSRYSEPCHE